MKVNLNLSTSRIHLQKQEHVNKTNSVAPQANSIGYGMLTFGGTKNPEQVALLTAETKPYFAKGGVATVVEQYPEHVFGGAKNTPIIMPYYNGKLLYDNMGEPKDVQMLMKDGKPIMTNASLKKVAVNNIDKTKYFELEKVAEKKMDFAGGVEDIAAYKVKGTNHYVIYTKETAMMPEPYADGSYGSETKKLLGKGRDAYAKFNKAVAELLPDLEKDGLNPKHIVLNDGQTAYFPEFIAQKIKDGKGDYFKDVKLSYVQHNLGTGYQQLQSARQMFLNFATNEQVEAVFADPKYLEALKKVPVEGDKAIEDYFRPMVAAFIDSNKNASASMIPIQYAKNGNLAHINTVSELYLANALKNPAVAPGLTKELQELSKTGKLTGILNGMSPSAGPEKPIAYKISETEVITPFKTFNSADPVEKIAEIKKANKITLLERFGSAGNDVKAVALAECVDPSKLKHVYGGIDPAIAQQLKNGENIKLFTSWGRGDLQKGLDNVLEAFEKLATTPEGKKAALVVAASLEDGSEEAEKIVQILERMAENPKLKGRYIYINGFGNANAFSMAADANIFPSRFAPCELTDLESMKFGTSTIVTDIEGLAQKNFDVRDGLDKATGYKVKANYDMLPDEFRKISPEFDTKYSQLIKKFTKNIDAKEMELNLAGADNSCIKQMREEMMENLLKSKDFEKLWRKYTDREIVKELAEAMSLKINEAPEVSNKLIRNTLDMKAMWENNDALHEGINKSAKLLYKERHLDGTMTAPSKPFFNFDAKILERVNATKNNISASKVVVPGAAVADTFASAAENLTDTTAFSGWNVKQSASNAVDSTKNLITEATTYTKSLLNRPLNKKIALATAGVVAATAALVYLFRPEKDTTNHASTYIA